MDLFPKFIIEDGILILSKVTYHREMVTHPEKVRGGGWFRYNSETNTFTLYGESQDFGPAQLEDIQKAIEAGEVYTDKYLSNNITSTRNFAYDTGSRIIPLNYQQKTINSPTN